MPEYKTKFETALERPYEWDRLQFDLEETIEGLGRSVMDNNRALAVARALKLIKELMAENEALKK